MIRSIEDVLTQLDPVEHNRDNIAELRIWAESIITACVENAEYQMCEMDLSDEENEGYLDRNGKQVYPVLLRYSIEKVREQIK